MTRLKSGSQRLVRGPYPKRSMYKSPMLPTTTIHHYDPLQMPQKPRRCQTKLFLAARCATFWKGFQPQRHPSDLHDHVSVSHSHVRTNATVRAAPDRQVVFGGRSGVCSGCVSGCFGMFYVCFGILHQPQLSRGRGCRSRERMGCSTCSTEQHGDVQNGGAGPAIESNDDEAISMRRAP